MTDKIQLPSFLVEETEEQIMNRKLSVIDDDIDKSEGSYIWDSLAPGSIEHAKAAEWAREVLRRAFIQSTFGSYLDLKGEEDRKKRRIATKATVEVLFSGSEGTVIPVGSRVATPSDNVTSSVEFEVVEQVTIDSSGEGTTKARALEAGSEGNVEAGTITVVLPGLNGVTAVINNSAASGGFDEEDDESYRQRLLEDESNDDGAGNKDDYRMWAQEISGVGKVIVESLWNGPGTVRVIIIDQNGEAANQNLIDQVQNHLDPNQDGQGEGRAPGGAIVTVDTTSIISINIEIPNLDIEDGYELAEVKSRLSEELSNYMSSKSPGDTVRVREVEAVIINAEGVQDTGEVLLNSSRTNITLSATQTASVGSVTYT